MSKQAQVGVFALLGMLLLFGVFYVITDYGTRHSGYRIGVHFNSAAGLSSGALVYFSGVTVGTVDAIQLLPDNSVDVILAINRDVSIPKDSQFLIQAPLTGSPNLLIVPPKPIPGVIPSPNDMLARQVLPVEQQARGRDTATLADLLDQGQGEVKRLDKMLADVSQREPRMLDSLQSTLDNANELTVSMHSQLNDLSGSLRSDLAAISTNVEALTANLNQTLGSDSPRLSSILGQMDQMSVSLNKSAQSLQQIATNPEAKASLVATAKNIRDTTANIAGLTHDLRSITGNPTTQEQMRNTVANVDAAMQRANSLLGQIGGTSCVSGVDACATPAPASATVPGASPYPVAPPYPPSNAPKPRAKLSSILHKLIGVQLRLGNLSRQTYCCVNPLLSKDRGPQTDVNAVLLPGYATSVLVGANDIGFHSTANIAVLEKVRPGLRLGGGVLYSRLGVIGQYNSRSFGIDARLYDPRYTMLDVYGNLNILRGLQLFAGQRDMLHRSRRNVYGLQFQF